MDGDNKLGMWLRNKVKKLQGLGVGYKVSAAIFVYCMGLWLLVSMAVVLSATTFSSQVDYQLPKLLWANWGHVVLWVMFSFFVVVFDRLKLLGHKYECRFILSSASKTMLTTLPIIVGLYGSVTSAKFIEWVNPAAGAESFPQYGIHIIVVMIVGIVLLSIRYSHLQQKVARKQSALEVKREVDQERRTKMLKEVIQLAPPKIFPSQLAEYADILEDLADYMVARTSAYLQMVEECNSKEKLPVLWDRECQDQRNIIRVGLAALARLAASFDNTPVGASSRHQYRANLMISFNVGEKAADLTQMEKFMFGEDAQLRFGLGHGAKPRYKLALNRNYSVYLEKDDGSFVEDRVCEQEAGGSEQEAGGSKDEHYQKSESLIDYTIKHVKYDPDVVSVFLPVYMSDENEKWRYLNVHGAPEAISTCHYTFVKDTVKKATNMLQRGFSRPLAEEVQKYVDGDKKGRSILSLPISHRRFLNKHLQSDAMLGTINIYRNEPLMFSGDTEKWEAFTDFTLPLQLSMSKIVMMHLEFIRVRPTE
jgi:hypothetical protein